MTNTCPPHLLTQSTTHNKHIYKPYPSYITNQHFSQLARSKHPQNILRIFFSHIARFPTHNLTTYLPGTHTNIIHHINSYHVILFRRCKIVTLHALYIVTFFHFIIFCFIFSSFYYMTNTCPPHLLTQSTTHNKHIYKPYPSYITNQHFSQLARSKHPQNILRIYFSSISDFSPSHIIMV